MNKSLFIGGTDTGVGKTLITGLAGRFLKERGVNVITQKWVQSGGGSGVSKDVKSHLKAMGIRAKSLNKYLPYIAPYVFDFPASPHFASRLEGKLISKDRIIEAFNILKADFEVLLVEGVGGLMVPYNDKSLIIDICTKIKIPVLLVSANRLGCINHTLLSLEAIKKRGLKILGIVFNRTSRKGEEKILRDNPLIIKEITGVKILGEIYWGKDMESLYDSFKPIGEKILMSLQAANEEKC